MHEGCTRILFEVVHFPFHGGGSNQFISVNIGVIQLLSVITTTPSCKNNVNNTGPSFRH